MDSSVLQKLAGSETTEAQARLRSANTVFVVRIDSM